MATDAEAMERLVEESRYVFRSTIVELNASNEPPVRSGPGWSWRAWTMHSGRHTTTSPIRDSCQFRGYYVELLLVIATTVTTRSAIARTASS
jgi:hypothetical protein